MKMPGSIYRRTLDGPVHQLVPRSAHRIVTITTTRYIHILQTFLMLFLITLDLYERQTLLCTLLLPDRSLTHYHLSKCTKSDATTCGCVSCIMTSNMHVNVLSHHMQLPVHTRPKEVFQKLASFHPSILPSQPPLHMLRSSLHVTDQSWRSGC